MKLNLKKLMYIQIYLLFTVRFIINIFGITYIAYICDIVNILMLFLMIKGNKKNKVSNMIYFFLLQLAYWIINYLCGSMTSLSLFFVMIRELVRFYIIFLAAGISLEREDYNKIFKIFDITIFIHAFLILIQLYILKERNIDAVGGIFGISYGYGNSTSHVFLIITLIITLYKYFDKKEKTYFSIIKIVVILAIGMMTEMKSIIYEVAIIVLLFFALNKRISFKHFILICSFLGIVLGFSNYINKYFNFNIFSIDEINGYIDSGYASNINGIGRTDGYEKVYKICFDNRKSKIWLGYGLGAATSSKTKAFYPEMNLEYFTYAKMFYDTGIIGSIFYFMFFVICLIKAIKASKIDKQLSILVTAMAVIGIYFSFYSAVMESDFSGYMIYMLLAIPYMIKKEGNNRGKKYEK